MNYDSFLFGCSSLPKIMTTEGKTNLELYAEAVVNQNSLYDSWQKCSAAYKDIFNKETETAKKKLTVLENWASKFADQETLVASLELVKNDIKLTQGTQKHLLDLWVVHEWDRQTPDIVTKYMEKGLKVEEKVLTLYSALTQVFYEKNKERHDDGFITGEIDSEDSTYIIDAKASWNPFTFKRNTVYINQPRSCPYYWNMQGYMRIENKDVSKVIYGLIDTPPEMVEIEKKKLLYSFIGNEQAYVEACDELERLLIYPDIPLDERIIEVVIERNEEDIALIEKTVIECRKYLSSIKKYNYAKMD